MGPKARPTGQPETNAVQYDNPGATRRGARVSPSAVVVAADEAGRRQRGQAGARRVPGGEWTEEPNAEMKGRKGERLTSTDESADEIASAGTAGAKEDEAGAAVLQEELVGPRSAGQPRPTRRHGAPGDGTPIPRRHLAQPPPEMNSKVNAGAGRTRGRPNPHP